MSAPQYPYPAPPPHDDKAKTMTAIAVGGVVASLAFSAFLLFQVHDLSVETAKNHDLMQNEIDTLKENTSVTTATQRKHVDDLREELDAKTRAANQAASNAKKEALSYADQQAAKLEAENRRTADSVNKVNTDLSGAISGVKQSADSANAKLADVGTDVNGVKSDLASTKNDLQQTKSDLKKVTGDLGITSDTVATNGKEIKELRRRGERTIVEFHLDKRNKKDYQKVGDISLLMKNTDPKKNNFTIDVKADDKITEKKNNINVPLQFYVGKSLYELVINTVGKDTIAGYLSTPKYQARN